MRPFSFFRCALALSFAVAFAVQESARADTEKLDALLSHVAPEAQFILAVPSLKKLNDDVTELLGGMDRADIIAAGRPIDFVKSMLGFGGGIDDRRGAALFLLPSENVRSAMLLVVPVVEPASFLETNFTRDESTGAYVAATGSELFIRELDGKFMLMGDNKELVERYKSGNGAGDTLRHRFGKDADAFFNRGEVIFAFDQSGAKLFAENFDLPGAFDMHGDDEAVAALNARRDAVVEQIAGVAYVLDADPMGVIAHGFAKFADGTTLADVLKKPAAPPAAWLGSLPGKKYYIAAGFDLQSAGAMTLIETIGPMMGIELASVAEPLKNVNQLSFICSPSPAGLTGGLLNDAALVMTSDDPKALHASLREALDKSVAQANAMARANDGNQEQGTEAPPSPPPFALKWTDNKKVGDDGITADAYEVNSAPTGNMVAMIAQSAIFGQSKRGFLVTAENAVIMTFSQRPAVLAAAINAADGRAGETLAGDAVLASVQQWMQAASAVELFVHLGEINKFAVTAAKSFGQAIPGMPQIDVKAPPMGLAFGVDDRAMTSTIALPAPLLAELVRIGEEQMGGRRGAPPQGGLE